MDEKRLIADVAVENTLFAFDKLFGYSIPAEGYNTFTFYITKEFVQLPDDDLDQLSYEITVKGEVDSDALASARATTTTATTAAD